MDKESLVYFAIFSVLFANICTMLIVIKLYMDDEQEAKNEIKNHRGDILQL